MVSKRKLIGALGCLLLLSACDGGVTLDQVVGHYEGFTVTQSGPAAAQSQASVSADIQKASPTQVVVHIVSESQPGEILIQATVSSAGRMQIASSSGFFPGTLTLNNNAGNCFSDAEKNQLCLGGREIQFSFASLGTKIVLDQMAKTTTAALEAPQDYTIDQLVERARTHNFDSQADFENVVQARLTASNAYLNLLPHINITAVVTGITAAMGALPVAILTAMHSIGDFVPFLLPSRWYEAQAAGAQSAADDDADKIVQASAMNVVQGLALSILRDEQSLERLKANELNVIQIRDQILATEHNGAGDIQLGSSDELNLVINSLDRSIEALKEALKEERTALSQGSGFMNPDAVALVEPIAVTPISGPIAGNVQDWQALAVRRSVALLQMDDLAVYARKIRGMRRFAWLDPSGDDNGSLGFGYVAYLQVGASMTRQIYDKKNGTESLLRKKVEDTLSDSQSIYNDYLLQIQASEINQNLIDRFMRNFHGGIAFSMTDLANALQGRAAADLGQMDDQYAFLILQAQLDFLTFAGPYAQLVAGNH